MKIARYVLDGKVRFGVVEAGAIGEMDGDLFGEMNPTGESHPLAEVELLPPCAPSKIVAVGLNYNDHAREMGMKTPDMPMLFMKPPSSLVAHERGIVYPRMSAEVHYEAELAIIIGRRCRQVGPELAVDCIAGYCCGNDVTARDLQRLDGQWTRAKGFDTFCPLGPFMETAQDVCGRRIELRLNGELKQSSSTGNMIFSCDQLVSFISRIMTLEPGDVILTGTPPGVGQLRVGDVVEVEIEGLSVLRNHVASPEHL